MASWLGLLLYKLDACLALISDMALISELVPQEDPGRPSSEIQLVAELTGLGMFARRLALGRCRSPCSSSSSTCACSSSARASARSRAVSFSAIAARIASTSAVHALSPSMALISELVPQEDPAPQEDAGLGGQDVARVALLTSSVGRESDGAPPGSLGSVSPPLRRHGWLESARRPRWRALRSSFSSRGWLRRCTS